MCERKSRILYQYRAYPLAYPLSYPYLCMKVCMKVCTNVCRSMSCVCVSAYPMVSYSYSFRIRNVCGIRQNTCILGYESANLYPCVSENFRGYMYSFLYPLRILILRDTNRAQLVFGIRRTKRIQKGYVYPNTFLGYARIRRIRIRAGRCSYPLILEYDEDTKIDTCILENTRIQHGYN